MTIVVPTKKKTGGMMDGRNVLGRKICNGDGADSFGQKAVSFQRKKRYVDQCNDANGGANFYEYGGGAAVSVFGGTIFVWNCGRSVCRKWVTGSVDGRKMDICQKTGGEGS